MLNPPVPMSRKSCPVALQVDILIVISPGCAAASPALSVVVVPATTTGRCIPVWFDALLISLSATSVSCTVAYAPLSV